MKAPRPQQAPLGFTIVESLLMIAVVIIFSGILYAAIKKDYLTPKQEAKAPTPAAAKPTTPVPESAPKKP
jgi:hypothetical protein